jgi:hypothetical protein
MSDGTQAERKRAEARAVRRITFSVGIAALGLTGGFAATASAQGPESLLFQPPPPAPPRVIDEVEVVHVPAPRPGATPPRGAGPAAAASAAPQSTTAVIALPPPPPPKPTATSGGSVKH